MIKINVQFIKNQAFYYLNADFELNHEIHKPKPRTKSQR